MPKPTNHLATASSANADQIAYWNSDAGKRWVRLQQRTDALFAEISSAAIEHAGVASGQRILDVGCGCGATVLALASRVRPDGRVVGVDVSKVMLDVAAERVRMQDLTNVQLLLADASAYPLDPAAFDLAFSRFGVMFFADPAGAFANVKRSLGPGGKLVFVCWRKMSENPWFLVPWLAAKPHLPPQPPPDPEAPGPFAFADPDRIRRILAAAGFSGIEILRHDAALELGGPGQLTQAADFAVQIGPVSRALVGADTGTREAVAAAVLETLRAHERPEGIHLGAGVWFVSARV
jgi:SAM-dependent methyltransferase